ncbi:hypothetical protein [Nocardia macrotermitis]|uniref:hypothetical protein n=1 Tax=Nocardia macrotermitis TaxID=2585198 RepID=UPI0029E7E048|nr:hypothetical protein [Nocardia macrotermitis]
MSTESGGSGIGPVVGEAGAEPVEESAAPESPVVEQAQQPVLVEWTAANRTGSISVRTTEQGLPLGISVDKAELRRDPGALAAEVLRLCKQAANRAALARRAEFEAAGVDSAALHRMGLPTPAEVAQSELVEEDEYETEPESWLRSV